MPVSRVRAERDFLSSGQFVGRATCNTQTSTLPPLAQWRAHESGAVACAGSASAGSRAVPRALLPANRDTLYHDTSSIEDTVSRDVR